jgi:hypothetical protein
LDAAGTIAVGCINCCGSVTFDKKALLSLMAVSPVGAPDNLVERERHQCENRPDQRALTAWNSASISIQPKLAPVPSMTVV